MADKAATRLNNEISKWNSQVNAKVVPAKTEEQELDSINRTSKRKRTASMKIRDSQPLDVSLTPKTEDLHGSEVIWRGNDVGLEAKKLFEAIEFRYPNTFKGVKITVKKFWKNNLEELHLAIKGFLESSVDALTEEEIKSLRQHFKDLELLKFDLSWVHEKLDMAARLKYGNNDLIAFDEKVVGLFDECKKAYEKLKNLQSEYEDAVKVRNKRKEEMALEFGQDFDRVLKERLGAGMLPGY